MFERTQVIFVAHSLKLRGSPSLTRCDSAPNLASDSPTSSRASSSRDSSTCAARTSEYIISPSAASGLPERGLARSFARIFIYEYYSADALLVKRARFSRLLARYLRDPRYVFSRYPVLKIHATTATEPARNAPVMARLTPTLTSASP